MQDREKYKELREFFSTFVDKYQELGKTNDNWEEIDKLCEYGENGLNKVFGNGIVKKIFGVDHPSIRPITIFFFKFAKIFADYTESKQKNMFETIEQTYGKKYIERSKLKVKS